MDDASLRSKYCHKYGLPPSDVDASTYQSVYNPPAARNDSLSNDSTTHREGADFEDDLMGGEGESSGESRSSDASESEASTSQHHESNVHSSSPQNSSPQSSSSSKSKKNSSKSNNVESLFE